MTPFDQAALAGAEIAWHNIREYGTNLDDHPEHATGRVGSEVIRILGEHHCESIATLHRAVERAWTIALEGRTVS